MTLFCNFCRPNNCCQTEQCCRPANNCCQTDQCACTEQTAAETPAATLVAAATTIETAPQTVRALLNTVLDSCCTVDDVNREICFELPQCFDPDNFEVGDTLTVEIRGDIFFKEASRNKSDCSCVSTVRYSIPVRIIITSPCGGPTTCIDRDITVIRSARLCCATNSVLTSYNTRVLAISAIVSEICDDRLTIMLSLLFRSCLQQTIIREYTWQATPVCETDNCADARKFLNDPCDVVCGCVAGIACPTC